MLLSNQAYSEFEKELCVCFSKDPKMAIVTTKKEAEDNKEDINSYITEKCQYAVDKCVYQALKVGGGMSQAYYSFVVNYPKLVKQGKEYYIVENGIQTILENGPKDHYYNYKLKYNTMIKYIDSLVDKKKHTRFLLTDAELQTLPDGGTNLKFVKSIEDLFRALKQIKAE